MSRIRISQDHRGSTLKIKITRSMPKHRYIGHMDHVFPLGGGGAMALWKGSRSGSDIGGFASRDISDNFLERSLSVIMGSSNSLARPFH